MGGGSTPSEGGHGSTWCADGLTHHVCCACAALELAPGAWWAYPALNTPVKDQIWISLGMQDPPQVEEE